MVYEITLANKLGSEMKTIHQYESTLIPQVGDLIPLEKEQYKLAFLVQKRILPDTSNNNKIVLLGYRDKV